MMANLLKEKFFERIDNDLCPDFMSVWLFIFC
ncbi:MAG: hypothetical protein JWP12_2384 [Bacteroidetes bacterium]|nr:hypothetical protein [Bacteroidota bacterium]